MKKQSLFAKHFFVTHYAGWGNEHTVLYIYKDCHGKDECMDRPAHKVTVTIDFFHSTSKHRQTDWIEAVELSYNDDVRILWEDVPKYMRRYIDNI